MKDISELILFYLQEIKIPNQEYKVRAGLPPQYTGIITLIKKQIKQTLTIKDIINRKILDEDYFQLNLSYMSVGAYSKISMHPGIFSRPENLLYKTSNIK
jgi:hypothetical protein